MANKYLERNATTGRQTEVVASDTSAGVSDQGKIVALASTGKLDPSLLPSGVGAATQAIIAGEALSAGDYVYIHDVAGTSTVSKASAGVGGNAAVGFVLAAVLNGNLATVYFGDVNSQVSGLTAGQRIYLSDVAPGAVVSNPVIGAGKLHQYIGRALSATEMLFEPEDAITLAA